MLRHINTGREQLLEKSGLVVPKGNNRILNRRKPKSSWNPRPASVRAVVKRNLPDSGTLYVKSGSSPRGISVNSYQFRSKWCADEKSSYWRVRPGVSTQSRRQGCLQWKGEREYGPASGLARHADGSTQGDGYGVVDDV